jgi:pimeloyl-ACP methyl ester carboxylesterase
MGISGNDQKIDLDGEVFAYREAGDPAATPVVLLHAATQDAASWDGVIPALADRHRVLALHQRGHGPSPHNPPYGFASLRTDLTRFVDRLGLDRFALAGHSMGGVTAYLFAEDQPRRLTKLVIEDTPPPLPGRKWNPPKPPKPPEGSPAFDLAALTPLFTELNEPDREWSARLGDIVTPTLIIAGGPSGQLDEEAAAEVARMLPDARAIGFGDTGHHVHLNKTATYGAAVRDFLNA